ncbi:MAG TPA: hypothetical protein DD827_01150, partial [Gammaproteobacteria bacterium]|nr:hypothetical protein [Gammaproteobacteria bacterium]
NQESSIKVNIAINVPVVEIKTVPSWGGATIEGENVSLFRDGKLISEAFEAKMQLVQEAQSRKESAIRLTRLREVTINLIKRNGWKQDKAL